MIDGQISLFDGTQPFINNKPIRLIELFAGYGSQALALKYIGISFEHYRISEWATKSIQAYRDMHFADDNTDYSKDMTVAEVKAWLYGKISRDYNTPMTDDEINRMKEKEVRTIYNNMQASHNLGSITQIKAEDLAIADTDKYCYIMTYSYPCQDCSLAGKGAGMAKGSGTRSALLWEVERLLGEMSERPQILLMENVPQVIGSTGIKDFAQWIAFLEQLGYKNYWQLMNAKDYGIPQNRNRCFMVSLLGDYYFNFPKPQKLTVRLKDFLDKDVDEKYYLSDKALTYINKRVGKYTQICDDDTEIAPSAITAVGNQNWTGNFVKDIANCVRGGGEEASIDTVGILLSNNPTGGGYCKAARYSNDRDNSRQRQKDCENDSDSCDAVGAGLQRAEHIRIERSSGNCERADGVLLNKSPDFQRGPLTDLSRTIDCNGMNGVVEWTTKSNAKK
ncbi:MAG: DNA (cytosine-5-)-methyltransferase [Eubacterium sp.]|nr:DNA (cytosine-5-)-methyltransferase [Eubacterium sp.]